MSQRDTILIDMGSVTCSSYACPTIFDMTDTAGNEFYFRLRHGYFRFGSELIDLASGKAPGDMGGVCDLSDVFDMIRSAGVNIETVQ